MIQLTQSGYGLCNGRVSIASKKNPTGIAVFEGFLQLLGADNDLAFGKFFRHLREGHNYIILSVHTVYYYIRLSEKVNKNK